MCQHADAFDTRGCFEQAVPERLPLDVWIKIAADGPYYPLLSDYDLIAESEQAHAALDLRLCAKPAPRPE